MGISLSERREMIIHSSAVASSVSDKIQRGEYATEETSCFCGGDNDIELVTHDRYAVPHRMVVCGECALIRANPRLTAEAYKAYYNNEYRLIHFGEQEEPQRIKGELLINRLGELDMPMPKVVVDFGCHKGGALDPFKEAGARTYGVDLDESARIHTASKGHYAVSSLDELIQLGIKADLIIFQDVIEHLLGFDEVKKLGELLSPTGAMYVFTPGFFRWPLRKLWQLAHTYQFCRSSLEYIMGELGFDQVYMDEEIEGFFKYVGPEKSFKFAKPAEWTEYITDHVQQKELRKMPPFRGTCKFTPKHLYTNIEANLSKRIPDLYEITNTYSGPVAIVAGGPSVNKEVDKLRELSTAGVPIMAINRMYPWCVQNGLTPSFIVSLDALEEQEKGFTHIVPGVTYLLASVTRPEIVEKLTGEKMYIWDTKDDDKVRSMREKYDYDACTVINGGGSVAIACLSLAMNLGFKDLHVFGLDCMFTDVEHSHAEGIAGESVKSVPLEVEIKGETYLTSGPFLEFARQALELFGAGHEEGLLDSVTVYGESLINKMWDGQFVEEAA